MTSQAPVVDWPGKIANLSDQISQFAVKISDEKDPAKQAELKVQQAIALVQQAKLELQQARNANLPEEEILKLKGNLEKANAHQERLQQGN